MDIEKWVTNTNPAGIGPLGATDWVDAYFENIGAGFRFYNFGNCEDCLKAPPPNPEDGKWHQWYYWYFSRGAKIGRVYPIPEIYGTSGTHAQQWQQLSKYAATKQNGKIYFPGVLSQWGNCKWRATKADCRADGKFPLDNRPQEAWVQLFIELYDDPDTRIYSLNWSTDIRFESE